jgi:hypothetical protein
MGRAPAVAVGVLTAVAFGLRLAGVGDSPWSDEIFTLKRIINHDALGDIFEPIRRTENNPPLFYVLAWAAAKIGDPTVWFRLPSLVLGTATVPLTYLLGRRTVGTPAALVAAAVVTLGPFAIFYSTEGRAYATLMFLSALSMLALLVAIERRGFPWWALYALCGCGLLYTHYTGAFLLLALAGWALWDGRARVGHLVAANAVIAVAFLPWLPYYLDQPEVVSAGRLIVGQEKSASGFGEAVLRVFPGHPFVPLGELPGEVVLWTIGCVLAAAILAKAAAAARRRVGRPLEASRGAAMWVVIAGGTVTGIGAYSLVDVNIFAPRNLTAAFVAAALAIGWLLTSMKPPLGGVATALVLGGLVVGTVGTLDTDNRRPPFKDAARFIDREARPGDAVVQTAVSGTVGFFYRRPHEAFVLGGDDGPAWEQAARGGQVFMVKAQVGLGFGLPPLAGPENRFVLRDRKVFRGSIPVLVGRYAGQVRGSLQTRNGRTVVSWSRGRSTVEKGAARGVIEVVSAASGHVTISGWAIDSGRRDVADWVLAFSDGRLIAVGWPNVIRPDLAKAFGRALLLAGYNLNVRTTRDSPLNLSRLRVFALTGNRASELERIGPAKKAVRDSPGS